MKITELDYYSIYGKSFLHKITAKYKLFVAVLILITTIFTQNLIILGGIYAFLLLLIIFSGVKKRAILTASFYPFIFLIVFFFSINNLGYLFFVIVVMRVICISTVFTLMIFTTNYKDLFNVLSKFLPLTVNKMLFFTYRSIFILAQIINDIKISTYLRGEPDIKRPVYSLKLIGNMLGLLVIKTIETSEKMYENMTIRGF